MTAIECAGCGARLTIPDGLAEGGGFTCSHCGLIGRNTESARRFRWADLEPYVRRHGVSRVNLWGGLIGSAVWIPTLGLVTAAQGRFSLPMFVGLAAPYLALLALLKQRRRRRPPVLWASDLWIGLGLFLVYIWLLCALFPNWMRPLVDNSGAFGGGAMPSFFWVTGVACVLVGALVGWLYRSWASRLPRVTGSPPAA